MFGFAYFVMIIAALTSIICLFVMVNERFRRIGMRVFLTGVAIAIVAGFVSNASENKEAQAKGWASENEMTTANSAGFTTPSEWQKSQKTKADAEAAKQASAQAARDALLRQPSDEVALIAAVNKGRAAYEAGQTDMQKGAARPVRAIDICNAVPSKQVSEWVGTISKLTTNSDGKGVISIDITDHLSVSTYNNALSDIRANTLIPPGSALYQKLLAMKEGTTVRFSGSLFQSDTDCLEEKSLSMAGSLDDPDFLFLFTGVTPIALPQE